MSEDEQQDKPFPILVAVIVVMLTVALIVGIIVLFFVAALIAFCNAAIQYVLSA